MWSSPCRPPWPTSPCRNKRAVFQILFRASAGRHHWLLLHPPYLGPICCFILTCIASSPAAAFRQRGTPGSPRAPTSSSVSGSYRASSAACFWRPSTTLTPKGISDSTADWPHTSHPIPRTIYPPGRPEQSALIGFPKPTGDLPAQGLPLRPPATLAVDDPRRRRVRAPLSTARLASWLSAHSPLWPADESLARRQPDPLPPTASGGALRVAACRRPDCCDADAHRGRSGTLSGMPNRPDAADFSDPTQALARLANHSRHFVSKAVMP